MADIIARIDHRGAVEMVDYMSIPLHVQRKVERVIKRAAYFRITLAPDCFQVMDGEIYIDSMDPGDWIDAMTMD